MDAFDLDVVDYLLKPISLDRFLRAIQKVYRLENTGTAALPAPRKTPHTQTDRFLYFRADRKMVKVMAGDILYIESLKDYVRIVTPGKQIVAKQTITSLQEMLPRKTVSCAFTGHLSWPSTALTPFRPTTWKLPAKNCPSAATTNTTWSGN